MATNYIQEGRVIDVVVAAAVSSGDAVVVGAMAGVAVNDGEIGDIVPMGVKGVWILPLETGGADLAIGTPVALTLTGEITGAAATTGEIAAAGKVACNGSLGADTHIEVLLTPGSANVAS